MKILHTSDWHLGQHFMGKSRREEHRAFLNWLLATVEEHHVDVVLVAGDVFDTGSPPSYAREMYHQLVLDMKARQCQLVVLAGNHDSVSMLNESKSLLGYLNTHVITQVNWQELEAHLIPLKNSAGKQHAWLCAVPYLRPKDILGSKVGQSEKDKKQAFLNAIADFYQKIYCLAQSQNALLERPLPIIGTGHLTALGGQLSESVRDLYVGTLEALPTQVFPNFDYLALGHIHRPQSMGRDGRIRYSGSPIPLSFDELGRNKSVVILNTDQLMKKNNGHHEQDTQLDLLTDRDDAIKLINVPVFQKMASLTGSIAELTDQIASLEVPGSGVLWLEVTVKTDDYISDIQKQLTHVLKDKPIELLRIIRQKKQISTQLQWQDKSTLAELSVTEVFNQALEEGLSVSEQEQAELKDLFRNCLIEIQESQGEGE
ncbi:exonuclease subunit SbcD [Marinomonas epiphytica]